MCYVCVDFIKNNVCCKKMPRVLNKPNLDREVYKLYLAQKYIYTKLLCRLNFQVDVTCSCNKLIRTQAPVACYTSEHLSPYITLNARA